MPKQPHRRIQVPQQPERCFTKVEYERLFIDVDYAQNYKDGQKIGEMCSYGLPNPENNQIVCTTSDGWEAGVKAQRIGQPYGSHGNS